MSVYVPSSIKRLYKSSTLFRVAFIKHLPNIRLLVLLELSYPRKQLITFEI